MDLTLLKELYQLGINLMAAHTCLTDLNGLAEMIKKDRPAKCQEDFCEAPSHESFRRWCLASTLESRSRPTITTQEKSFDHFLLEEGSQKVSRALFKDAPTSSIILLNVREHYLTKKRKTHWMTSLVCKNRRHKMQ